MQEQSTINDLTVDENSQLCEHEKQAQSQPAMKSKHQSSQSANSSKSINSRQNNKCAIENNVLSGINLTCGFMNAITVENQVMGISHIENRQKVAEELQSLQRENDKYKRKHRETREQCRKNVQENQTKEQEEIDVQNRENEESVQSEQEDGNSSENPNTMDVKVVLQMFKDLKKEIKGMKIENGEERIREVEERQDTQSEQLLYLRAELEEYKTKTEVLTGIVSRMSDVMSNLVLLNRFYTAQRRTPLDQHRT